MKSSSIKPEIEFLAHAREEEAAEPSLRSDEPMLGYLRLCWERRRMLFRVAAWSLLAATLIAFLLPKRYQSTTRLMPPDDQSSAGMALMATLSGKMSGGLGAMAGDALGIKTSGALFIGILDSRTVQDGLINKFDLKKVYWKKSWAAARLTLASNTALVEDRKSGIISITVTDHSPERAAAMAEEYVAQLNAVASQLSTSSAHRERVFLEGRLQEVKQDLTAAEKDFSEFSSKNTAIDIKEQGRALVDAAAVLQGQMIAAQSELQGLRQVYADGNVRVRTLTARVAELRSQLEKLGGKAEIGKDLTNPADDSLYPTIRKLPLLGVAYADLYRRTKVQEAVFETLTQEYEMAKVSEAKETPSVKVLDPAVVPENRSFPPRLLIMFLGMCAGFVGAALWTVMGERWKQTDRDDPRKLLLQEIFGTVNGWMPWATPNGSKFQGATHRVWVRLRPRDGGEETLP